MFPVAGQAVRAEGADLLPLVPDEHLLHPSTQRGACGLRGEGAACWKIQRCFFLPTNCQGRVRLRPCTRTKQAVALSSVVGRAKGRELSNSA